MKISELSEGPEREALLKEFGEEADVMQVAKGFIETKRKLSSSPRMPDPDASPEEMSKLYERLGRPASADAYEMPETSEAMKPVLESLRSVAYDQGLSQKQFEALASQAGAVASGADKQIAEARAKWEQSVREQHGEKADRTLTDAQSQLNQLLEGDAETKAIFERFGLDKHPGIVNLLTKVNQAMGEDSPPGVNASPPAETAGPTPTELFQEAMKIMGSDAFKQGERHPEFRLAGARLTEINDALRRAGMQGVGDPRFRQGPTVTLADGSRHRL